jgi:hypothetical protein
MPRPTTKTTKTTTRSPARGVRSARELLIQSLQTAFDQRSWHGATLLGSIRSVDAKLATQRLRGTRRKTIWEQVLHAAYWKHVVVNRLAGATRFPRRGSNWPRVPDELTETTWRADVDLLKATQRRLIEVVESLPENKFDEKTIWLLHGAAAHDLYHAGQIKLLRKLLPET